jgi:hypothetical protein
MFLIIFRQGYLNRNNQQIPNTQMKFLIPFLALFAAILLRFPFAAAKEELRSSFPMMHPELKLQQPLIPLEIAGSYVSNIGQMKNLLAQKQLNAFYVKADEILDAIEHNRSKREKEKGEEYYFSTEDVAAFEWISYYALSAPLFSGAEGAYNDFAVKARIASHLR